MFDLDKGKLIIKKEDLMLPDFHTLYKKDKSRTKDEVLKLFLYMHLVSQLDPKAPYANEDPTRVKQLSKKMVYGDSGYKFSANSLLKDEALVDAITKLYVETCVTPARSMIISYNTKIYQLKKLIEDTKPEIVKSSKVAKGTDEDGNLVVTDVKFVTNADIVHKMMTSIEGIMQARDRLAAMVENEAGKSGKVKANAKKSYLEQTHGK